MITEEFLDEWERRIIILKQRLDGFWEREETIPVKSVKKEEIRVVGTVGELLAKEKRASSGEGKKRFEDDRRKIEERTRTLERILPYEAKAFRKIKYGTTFDVGTPKQKITVQEQPSVEKVDEVVNEVVRGILRNQYVTVGADGRMYQYQNMPRLLREKAKEKGLIKR